MSLKYVPFLFLALGAGIIGHGLWKRQRNPPHIVSTGTFQFTDHAGALLIFPKRVMAVGEFEAMQVQLPSNTWIDCRGDCEATIKAEYN